MPRYQTTRVAVGGTAVLVAPARARRQFAVRNLGPGRAYLGGPGVTAGSGLPLEPGELRELGDLSGQPDELTIEMWAVADGGADLVVEEIVEP